MKTRLRIPTMLVIPACLFLAACQSPSGQPLSAYDFRHDWISAGELHSLENAHQISILLRKGREIRRLTVATHTSLGAVLQSLGDPRYIRDGEVLLVKENAIVHRQPSFAEHYKGWNSMADNMTVEPGDVLVFRSTYP